MTKLLFSFLLLISLFYADIHADILPFRAGQKASYTISQKLDADNKIFDATQHIRSEATIDLDIEILSVDQQTSSYPYDVRVTLKKVHFSEIQQEGKTTNLITYDTGFKDLKTAENYLLAKYYDRVINHPLYFRVEKDFQVVEINGYLTQIHDDLDSPDSMGLFGATPWTYELFLTQLFHLSGEDLQTGKSYPVSCYQFLNWERVPLDEQQISLYQVSDYIIESIDPNTINASWQGNAKVFDYQLFMEGSRDVSVATKVSWNTANPLIQTRHLKAEMESTTNGFIKSLSKIALEQTWQPTSRNNCQINL